MRAPRASPAQRVAWGEEPQGNGAINARQGVGSGADFAATKEQGISRILTTNLNDVEKELKIR